MRHTLFVLFTVCSTFNTAAFADEKLEALEKRIVALEARLSVLEKEQDGAVDYICKAKCGTMSFGRLTEALGAEVQVGTGSTRTEAFAELKKACLEIKTMQNIDGKIQLAKAKEKHIPVFKTAPVYEEFKPTDPRFGKNFPRMVLKEAEIKECTSRLCCKIDGK